MKLTGNNAELGGQISAMVAGLQSSLPPGMTTLTFGGQVYQVTNLVTSLSGYAQYWTTAKDLEAQAHKAVQDRDSEVAAARALYNAVKQAVRSTVGDQSPTLLKFGLKPRKDPRKLTTDERSVAVDKLRNTRKENKTEGTQQKKAADSNVSTPPPSK